MSNTFQLAYSMPIEKRIYLLENMPLHLFDAGQNDKIRQILVDYFYLLVSIDTVGTQVLLRHFDLADAEVTNLIRDAIREAEHNLRYSGQFPGQLVGRLLRHSGLYTELDNLLDAAKQQDPAGRVTLVPMTNSLISAGGALFRTISFGTRISRVLCLNDDRRVLIGVGGVLWLWDYIEGHQIHRWGEIQGPGNLGEIYSVAADHEWTRVLIGTYASCYILDLGDFTLKPAMEKEWHRLSHQRPDDTSRTSNVVATAVNFLDRYTALLVCDGKLLVLDLESRKILRTIVLPVRKFPLEVKALLPLSNSQVIVGLDGPDFFIFDLESDTPPKRFRGYDGPDMSIANKTVKYAKFLIWYFSHYLPFLGHYGNTHTILASSISGLTFTGADTVKLWHIGTRFPLRTLRSNGNTLHALAMSHDKRFLFTAHNRVIRQWTLWPHPLTARPIRKFEGHSGFIHSLSISATGKYFVSGSTDNSVKIWQLTKQRKAQDRHPHDRRVGSIAIAPDERFAISVAYNTGSPNSTGTPCIKIWDLNADIIFQQSELLFWGSPVWDLTQSAAISPDNRHIIARDIKDIFKWTRSGRLVACKRINSKYGFHMSDHYPIVFSGDSKYFVITISHGMADSALQIYDVETLSLTRTIATPNQWLNAVCMLSNGTTIVSAGDGEIAMWDMYTGKKLAELPLMETSPYNTYKTPMRNVEQGLGRRYGG